MLDTFSSADAPLGALHVRCGNRRAAACPSCSRVYARDTFAMVNAGVCGGKTVPESVAANPLLFVTLTAPSFGPVHGARERSPLPPPHLAMCPMASPLVPARARRGDSAGGAPICRSVTTPGPRWSGSGGPRSCGAGSPSPCAATWPRVLGSPTRACRGRVRAVRQGRRVPTPGVVHFHALVRLDGPPTKGSAPRTPGPPRCPERCGCRGGRGARARCG